MSHFYAKVRDLSQAKPLECTKCPGACLWFALTFKFRGNQETCNNFDDSDGTRRFFVPLPTGVDASVSTDEITRFGFKEVIRRDADLIQLYRIFEDLGAPVKNHEFVTGDKSLDVMQTRINQAIKTVFASTSPQNDDPEWDNTAIAGKLKFIDVVFRKDSSIMEIKTCLDKADSCGKLFMQLQHWKRVHHCNIEPEIVEYAIFASLRLAYRRLQYELLDQLFSVVCRYANIISASPIQKGLYRVKPLNILTEKCKTFVYRTTMVSGAVFAYGFMNSFNVVVDHLLKARPLDPDASWIDLAAEIVIDNLMNRSEEFASFFGRQCSGGQKQIPSKSDSHTVATQAVSVVLNMLNNNHNLQMREKKIQSLSRSVMERVKVLIAKMLLSSNWHFLFVCVHSLKTSSKYGFTIFLDNGKKGQIENDLNEAIDPTVPLKRRKWLMDKLSGNFDTAGKQMHISEILSAWSLLSRSRLMESLRESETGAVFIEYQDYLHIFTLLETLAKVKIISFVPSWKKPVPTMLHVRNATTGRLELELDKADHEGVMMGVLQKWGQLTECRAELEANYKSSLSITKELWEKGDSKDYPNSIPQHMQVFVNVCVPEKPEDIARNFLIPTNLAKFLKNSMQFAVAHATYPGSGRPMRDELVEAMLHDHILLLQQNAQSKLAGFLKRCTRGMDCMKVVNELEPKAQACIRFITASIVRLDQSQGFIVSGKDGRVRKRSLEIKEDKCDLTHGLFIAITAFDSDLCPCHITPLESLESETQPLINVTRLISLADIEHQVSSRCVTQVFKEIRRCLLLSEKNLILLLGDSDEAFYSCRLEKMLIYSCCEDGRISSRQVRLLDRHKVMMLVNAIMNSVGEPIVETPIFESPQHMTVVESMLESDLAPVKWFRNLTYFVQPFQQKSGNLAAFANYRTTFNWIGGIDYLHPAQVANIFGFQNRLVDMYSLGPNLTPSHIILASKTVWDTTAATAHFSQYDNLDRYIVARALSNVGDTVIKDEDKLAWTQKGKAEFLCFLFPGRQTAKNLEDLEKVLTVPNCRIALHSYPLSLKEINEIAVALWEHTHNKGKQLMEHEIAKLDMIEVIQNSTEVLNAVADSNYALLFNSYHVNFAAPTMQTVISSGYLIQKAHSMIGDPFGEYINLDAYSSNNPFAGRFNTRHLVNVGLLMSICSLPKYKDFSQPYLENLRRIESLTEAELLETLIISYYLAHHYLVFCIYKHNKEMARRFKKLIAKEGRQTLTIWDAVVNNKGMWLLTTPSPKESIDILLDREQFLSASNLNSTPFATAAYELRIRKRKMQPKYVQKTSRQPTTNGMGETKWQYYYSRDRPENVFNVHNEELETIYLLHGVNPRMITTTIATSEYSSTGYPTHFQGTTSHSF